jgi:hypothetical protein
MGESVERRASPRRVPQEREPLARVRLRTGRDVDVLDVSDGGVCVDGRARLLPGTHVDVHVVTAGGRVLARCRVVRSHVSRIERDGVSYRSALAFQQAIDTRTPGYAFPSAVGETPTSEGTPYPAVA